VQAHEPLFLAYAPLAIDGGLLCRAGLVVLLKALLDARQLFQVLPMGAVAMQAFRLVIQLLGTMKLLGVGLGRGDGLDHRLKALAVAFIMNPIVRVVDLKLARNEAVDLLKLPAY
jgi:hypothetical protein